jgi:hypothetical protein
VSVHEDNFAANWVYAAISSDGDSVALLNIKTGIWFLAVDKTAWLWVYLEMGLSLNEAVSALSEEFRKAEKDIRGDLEGAIRELRKARLLTHEAGKRRVRPVLAGADPVALRQVFEGRAPDKILPVPGRYKAAAAVGVTVALVLARFPLCLSIRIMRAARLRHVEPCGSGDAEILLAAARWAARFYWGRTACYEVPLGAFLAGVLLGKAPRWGIGAWFNPLRPHAGLLRPGGTLILESDERIESADHWHPALII